MRRLALLTAPLLALAACPDPPVNPGGAGLSSSATATTATTGAPTSAGTPTTGATSSGGDEVPTGGSGAGTSGEGSASGGTSGEAGASSGEGGSSTGDSGIGGTGTTGEPPVYADCFECVCDINVSFCRKVFAGVTAVQKPARPVCPIVAAEGQESGCVLFPPRCEGTPDCACLPTMDGDCFCNLISPGNYQVTCPLP